MPSRAIDASGFSPDTIEFIRLLGKSAVRYSRLPAYYIGVVPLATNKKASGRPKDLADLVFLEAKRRKKGTRKTRG